MVVFSECIGWKLENEFSMGGFISKNGKVNVYFLLHVFCVHCSGFFWFFHRNSIIVSV